MIQEGSSPSRKSSSITSSWASSTGPQNHTQPSFILNGHSTEFRAIMASTLTHLSFQLLDTTPSKGKDIPTSTSKHGTAQMAIGSTQPLTYASCAPSVTVLSVQLLPLVCSVMSPTTTTIMLQNSANSVLSSIASTAHP